MIILKEIKCTYEVYEKYCKAFQEMKDKAEAIHQRKRNLPKNLSGIGKIHIISFMDRNDGI